MASDTIKKWIRSDPAVMMGKPVIAGTRITVELILEKLSAGETIEQIVSEHPRLTEEAIRAALAFATEAFRADVIYPVEAGVNLLADESVDLQIVEGLEAAMKSTHTMLFVAILAFVLLFACAPAPTIAPTATASVLPIPAATATATSQRTETPLPTATPTQTPPPTATPLPQAQLKAASDLYAGPDVYGYDTVAHLLKGATVTPLGVFGDFVQIQTQVSGTVKGGYVPAQLLDPVPANLPPLAKDQLSWETASNLINLMRTEKGRKDGDTLIVENGQVSDYYGWSTYGNPLTPSGPFGIVFRFSGKGEHTSITLDGHLAAADKQWWEDHIEMRVVYYGTNSIRLEVYDGKSDRGNTLALRQLNGYQAFSIMFLDAQGKQFHVVDGDGKGILDVDISKLAGVNLPNGLFPEKQIYPGVLLSPSSQLTISQLSLLAPQDGKYVASRPSILGTTTTEGVDWNAYIFNGKEIDELPVGSVARGDNPPWAILYYAILTAAYEKIDQQGVHTEVHFDFRDTSGLDFCKQDFYREGAVHRDAVAVFTGVSSKVQFDIWGGQGQGFLKSVPITALPKGTMVALGVLPVSVTADIFQDNEKSLNGGAGLPRAGWTIPYSGGYWNYLEDREKSKQKACR